MAVFELVTALVGMVVPIPTSPVEVMATLTVPAVITSITSSSAPADDSARIKVSPSTSFTPPREPQALPAPYPSKVDNSVLYLI